MQPCWSEQSSNYLQQTVQVLGELVKVRVASQPCCQLRLCHQLLSLESASEAGLGIRTRVDPKQAQQLDKTTRQVQVRIGQEQLVITQSRH